MRIGFWTVGGAALLLLITLYLLNPLDTASSDPRLRLLGIAPFTQPSQSMAPALQAGDIVLVSAWPYAASEPVHGDIVVFLAPQAKGVMFVKRLVGLPGEQLELRDGELFINGEKREEPYLHPVEAGSFRRPERSSYIWVTISTSCSATIATIPTTAAIGGRSAARASPARWKKSGGLKSSGARSTCNNHGLSTQAALET